MIFYFFCLMDYNFTSYLIIAFTVVFASALTFFSGFGLGTLMLPVFSLFFPLETAVAATAIVHFINNIFKFGLVFKHVHYATLFRFGFPAMLAAFIGALLLGYIGTTEVSYHYTWFNREMIVTPLKLTIGCLMIFFALFELVPSLTRWKIDQRYMPLGGILSGFFGGISGHQGAFRSVFLTKTGLSKEEFIGTSTAIALIIDLSRIIIYTTTFLSLSPAKSFSAHLITGIIFAFIGTYFGKLLLSKTTMTGIQRMVGLLLIFYGLLFLLGVF